MSSGFESDEGDWTLNMKIGADLGEWTDEQAEKLEKEAKKMTRKRLDVIFKPEDIIRETIEVPPKYGRDCE